MYGARYSLIIGFAASILNLFIGIIYGGIAGLVGGMVDNVYDENCRYNIILYLLTIYVILFMVILEKGWII